MPAQQSRIAITRRTLYSVVRRAAPVASEWYSELAKSYPVGAGERAEFGDLARDIARIASMSLAEMDGLSAELVFATLVAAEDWERSLYDANVTADPTTARRAKATADRYRSVRLATLGRSRWEADMAQCSVVGLDDLWRSSGSPG